MSSAIWRPLSLDRTVLTHWGLNKDAHFKQMVYRNSWQKTSVFLYNTIFMVVSAGTGQSCFRLWLKSNMLQASTYINDDEDRWRICASLGDNAFLPFLLLRSEYFARIVSILLLLMHWLLVSPSHQQPWYWLSRVNVSNTFLSSMRTAFSYLCHLSLAK